MQCMRWWVQAIYRGMTMAMGIWLAGAIVSVAGLLLIGSGPLEFLRLVGYLLVIVLAFTSPLWVPVGLMILVFLGLPETRE